MTDAPAQHRTEPPMDQPVRVPLSRSLTTALAAVLGGAGLMSLGMAPAALRSSSVVGLIVLVLAWALLGLAGAVTLRGTTRTVLATALGVELLALSLAVAARGTGTAVLGFEGLIMLALLGAGSVLAGLLVVDYQGARVLRRSARVLSGAAIAVVMLTVSAAALPALGRPVSPVGGAPHPRAQLLAGAEQGGHDSHDHRHGRPVDPSTTTAGGHADHDVDAGQAAAASGPVPTGHVGHDTAVALSAPSGHDHTGSVAPSPATPPAPDDHDHTTPPPTTGAGPCVHPIITVSDPCLSAAQQARAQTLITATRTALASFSALTDDALRSALTSAGYAAIGDGGQFAHWVHWGRYADGAELSAGAIESVVLERDSDGSWRLGSAMYVLNAGKTLADVPEIAGALTTFHVHTNLCWVGNQLVGTTQGGACTRGELRVTPPMLHVWMTDRACGPFAETEERSSGSCTSTHDH